MLKPSGGSVKQIDKNLSFTSSGCQWDMLTTARGSIKEIDKTLFLHSLVIRWVLLKHPHARQSQYKRNMHKADFSFYLYQLDAFWDIITPAADSIKGIEKTLSFLLSFLSLSAGCHWGILTPARCRIKEIDKSFSLSFSLYIFSFSF